MNGLLPYSCLKCHQRLSWQKVDFISLDNYPDWRIDISCSCSTYDQAEYPCIHARGRAALDVQVGIELETQRRNYLDAMLGKSGNLYFETLLKALPT